MPKIMGDGKLGCRKVDSHPCISVESLEAYKEWERAQMSSGLEETSRRQNELGLAE